MFSCELVVNAVSYLDPLYNRYVIGSKEKKLQALKGKVDGMSNAEIIANMSILNELYQLEKAVFLEGFWEIAKINMIDNKCTNISCLNEKLNILITTDGFIKDYYFYPTPSELWYASEITEIEEYLKFLIKESKFSKKLNNEDIANLYLFDPIYGYIVGEKETRLFKLQHGLDALKHSRKKHKDDISKMQDYETEISRLKKEIPFSGFWTTAKQNMLQGKRPSKEVIDYIEKKAGIKIYRNSYKKDNISHEVPAELWYAKEVEEIIKYIREIDFEYFIKN